MKQIVAFYDRGVAIVSGRFVESVALLLLRVALGLQREGVSGAISLLGRDLAASDGETLIGLRRRCGYICQDPYGGLPPTLSALDAAAEPQAEVWRHECLSQLGTVDTTYRQPELLLQALRCVIDLAECAADAVAGRGPADALAGA